MKRLALIWFWMLVLAGCNRPIPATVETVHAPSPQPELAAIDTLMQTRPDSALTLLLAEPKDEPYYQLLLSEALYKNDSAQQNRPELLEAMAYFDSIGIPFLSARCNYMNGVGYYEMDSVVSACAEYLKALEIMEEHFEEKDLVGYKAKFMALTYTRLCKLFSDQYLQEQAIYFGKQSLPYYNRYHAEPWHKAWILNKIGSLFFMMQQCDSAECYFDKAIEVLPDTNNLTYRDVATIKAFLSYNKDQNPKTALKQLHNLLEQSESESEYIARIMIVGEIYFLENQFDSALFWLEPNYSYICETDSKLWFAQRLKEIYESLNMPDEETEYIQFLAENAATSDYQSDLYSCLSELYHSFRQAQQEIQHRKESQISRKKQYLFFGFLTAVIAIVWSVAYQKHKKKFKKQKELLETQQANSEKTHKKLADELKRIEKESVDILVKYELCEAELVKRDNDIEQLKAQIEREEKRQGGNHLEGIYKDFRREPVCQSIVSSVRNANIKTERKVTEYKGMELSSISYRNYLLAINKHSGDFLKKLIKHYPDLTQAETKLCCLILLDLKDKELAVLLQISYQALGKQMRALLKKTNESRDGLVTIMLNLAFLS